MIHLYFYVKFQRFIVHARVHLLISIDSHTYQYSTFIDYYIAILCNGSGGVASVSKLAAPFTFYCQYNLVGVIFSVSNSGRHNPTFGGPGLSLCDSPD